MSNRGKTILHGVKCLGNTIRGANQNTLRQLYRACVLPALTYASPTWYRSDSPQKGLIEILEKVQNQGLRRILGAFRTTPSVALNVLSYVPPLQLYIQKLSEGYALRMFRLPLLSPVTQRLPNSYRNKKKPTSKVIPFGPPLPPERITSRKGTILQYICSLLPPSTERTDPFHSHNAP